MEALSQLSYGPARNSLISKGINRLCQGLKRRPVVSEGRENTRNPPLGKRYSEALFESEQGYDLILGNGTSVAHSVGDWFSAAFTRASDRSRPSNASVASIGGETAEPATATRRGWATFPKPV